MLVLIRFFIQLALLRRAPQDLPASPVLLVMFAVLSALVGTVNGMELFGSARAAFGANLLDLFLTMVLLFALLQLKGHLPRWQQTATAFFGLGVLAGLIMMLVRAPAEMLGISDLAMLVDLVLAVWLHIALGSVLRHALEVPLLAGVMIVLSYTVLGFNLIAQVFPPILNS